MFNIFKKIVKGVKAGMAAVKESNTLDDNQVVGEIREFNSSEKRKLMLTGQRYYEVDNDIFQRKMSKVIDGNVINEAYKANHKLAHANYKNQVDEKVNYLLSKAYTLTNKKGDKGNNKEVIEAIKNTLGEDFGYTLSGLGYEATNKGIAWLQPYIDGEGNFKFLIVPSEQCIPTWTDNSHTELESMIRCYVTTYWVEGLKKEQTNVEVWTKEGVKYYTLDNNTLVYDYNRSNDIDAGGPVSHFQRDGQWVSWGKVPFVPFKNNRIEVPDIKFIKSLLDGYDTSRSDAANYIDEVKNLIFILKGYGGEDIGEFMNKLNYYRAVPIDDTEGGVDTISPSMDITALKEHYEQLKRDLTESGQSVNKDLDKFGSSPSGIALKFMYSGLDLKCNAMETEFKHGFKKLLYFINVYFGEKNISNFDIKDIDIVFNRNMTINESETIQNCNNSKGTIPDDIVLAHHPWVDDVEAAKAQLKAQNQEEAPFQDRIPINGDVSNGEK